MAILALVFIVALAVLSYLGTIRKLASITKKTFRIFPAHIRPVPNNPNTPLATTPKVSVYPIPSQC